MPVSELSGWLFFCLQPAGPFPWMLGTAPDFWHAKWPCFFSIYASMVLCCVLTVLSFLGSALLFPSPTLFPISHRGTSVYLMNIVQISFPYSDLLWLPLSRLHHSLPGLRNQALIHLPVLLFPSESGLQLPEWFVLNANLAMRLLAEGLQQFLVAHSVNCWQASLSTIRCISSIHTPPVCSSLSHTLCFITPTCFIST